MARIGKIGAAWSSGRRHVAGRLRQQRALAETRGLDRNVWFDNVERIASERIGRGPVRNIGNIFKYYVAYRLVLDQTEAPGSAKKATG